MKERGVSCVFHYVPLYSSPYGIQFGRVAGDLSVTDELAERKVRMRIWVRVEDVCKG